MRKGTVTFSKLSLRRSKESVQVKQWISGGTPENT